MRTQPPNTDTNGQLLAQPRDDERAATDAESREMPCPVCGFKDSCCY
jgi:hypothetical protein